MLMPISRATRVGPSPCKSIRAICSAFKSVDLRIPIQRLFVSFWGTVFAQQMGREAWRVVTQSS